MSDTNLRFSYRSQNSPTEERKLPAPKRRDDWCTLFESLEQNPFRRFLSGESFSNIHSASAIDLNLTAQTFHVSTRTLIMLRRSLKENAANALDEQPEVVEQKIDETLCDDDDMPSSSGCSSASSTNGDNSESENQTDANRKNDLNDTTNKEEEYSDDFYDSFPNDILNKLPDGLREVIAQIRENTHTDLRQRHKESRVTMMVMADEIRSRKKVEMRAKLLGDEPPPSVLKGPVNFYRRELRESREFGESRESRTKSSIPRLSWTGNESNVVVIDNTNVTLRKKGTSQINLDEEFVEEEEFTDGAVDDLKEFNSHNYWYISPSSVDIENELKLLKSSDPQPPQGNSNCIPYTLKTLNLLFRYRTPSEKGIFEPHT